MDFEETVREEQKVLHTGVFVTCAHHWVL